MDCGDQRVRHHSHHQHRCRFASRDIYKQNSADRSDHGNSAKHEWIDNSCWISGKCQESRQDRAHQTDGVCFENIRSHACAIANVISDIISDHRGVTWIVFLETALDLAHQIRAYIGGLGVNAATQPCEDANETTAKRESHQTPYRSVTSDHLCRDRVENGY